MMNRVSGEEPMARIPSRSPDELRVQESVQVLFQRFRSLRFFQSFIHAEERNLMEEILGDALFSFVVGYFYRHP